MDALSKFIANFKEMSELVIDSYFIVDAERNIVDYNRAFFSMLPRQVARSAKGKKCFEVLQHDICKSSCIAEQCWRDKRHVRLDEIHSRASQTDQNFRFILSALPILDESGNAVGAVEIQRNVTDEAMVQVKYQEMLDSEARERERLAAQIRVRTRELMETNRSLIKTQKELMAYRKGLLL